MIKNISDLKKVVSDNYWKKLDNITPEYLNDAGKAAKEAYRTVLWYLCFHDNMDTLIADEEFMNIVNIPGKHPEFYKIIKKINRAIEKIVKE